jgi:hypothetical protein
MSVTKLPYGRPVKVLVDLQGFPDGRLVRFEVWRKKVQGEEKAAELYGSTNAGKAVAFWNPDFGERAVKLQETPTFEKVDEKYYFVSKVDDKEKKSQDFELTFPLILHFEDEEESLDDVGCAGGFGAPAPVYPMNTFPTAMTDPTGASAGSLHVMAWSPCLAAGFPFMKTTVLPTRIFPWFVGGFWNGPAVGMCGGWFMAMLSTVAAGFPSMKTSVLRPAVSVPLKGMGVGVGTGPPGEGTIRMWVSVAMILSPCLAAGLLIAFRLPSLVGPLRIRCRTSQQLGVRHCNSCKPSCLGQLGESFHTLYNAWL